MMDKVHGASPKNYLVSYIFNKIFLEKSKRYIRGQLIDIGCGSKPYKTVLAKLVTKHIGIDTPNTPHNNSSIDLFSTAYSIPIEDNSFDSAICTAVLEHLEEPELAVKECFRVLKPGGIAIYSIPFIWHIHEAPRDFYRFSRYGIEYLFNKSGFKIIELKALSGFWVTFGQLLVYNIYRFNRGPFRWFGLIGLLAAIIQIFAFLLDKIDKTEIWTWMYLVIAKKPES